MLLSFIFRHPGLLPLMKAVLLTTPPSQAIQGQQLQQEHRSKTFCTAYTEPDLQAVQVHAVALLRVLSSSSLLSAQLVKSCGVVPSLQGHLLVSCSMLKDDASADDVEQQQAPHTGALIVHAAASSATHHSLMVTEILRLWRACAAHNMSLMPFETFHLGLAPLMQPAQQISNTNISEVQAVLRWHIAREVYSVLDVLMTHALAVARGDRTIGSPMLQPGTAAALAQDMSRDWLTVAVVTRMAGSAIDTPGWTQPPVGGHAADWSAW